MKLYPLDKTVLSIRNQPQAFLNGITANTADKPQNAFVNVHGKIIATFDQVKVSEDEFFIVVTTAFVPSLLEHLDRYARLSKVTITKKDYKVYFDLENNYKAQTEEFIIPQKNGRLVITPRALPTPVSQEEFTLFRLKNNIPLHGVDYQDEFLLNVSQEDFVSFTKGCFLGQEPIAKVHNRSQPTWKLTVQYEDDCGPEEKAKMTSKTLEPQSGRSLGFVFVKNQ